MYAAWVVLSWLALGWLMWVAFRTVPTAAELADARHIRPPLPADLLLNLLTSAVEAVFTTAMLWPWWRRWYGWRALATTLVLSAWFLFTVPLDVNQMEFLHRRWLALLALSALGVSVSTFITTGLESWKSGRPS